MSCSCRESTPDSSAGHHVPPSGLPRLHVAVDTVRFQVASVAASCLYVRDDSVAWSYQESQLSYPSLLKFVDLTVAVVGSTDLERMWKEAVLSLQFTLPSGKFPAAFVTLSANAAIRRSVPNAEE
jgi:hypothetical protein